MALLGQYSIDDRKTGMFDTNNEQSPFYTGGEVEKELERCAFCLEDHEDDNLILTFSIKTKKPELICIECAECMDDEFHINNQLKINIQQHGNKNLKKINCQAVIG